jgi:hypothetical protein
MQRGSQLDKALELGVVDTSFATTDLNPSTVDVPSQFKVSLEANNLPKTKVALKGVIMELSI